MSGIRLASQKNTGYTLVSHHFIDQVMPLANGEFVKIYLYLLRLVQTGEKDISLSGLADIFACTEKDVLRALTWWANQKELSLQFDEQQQLCGIDLTEDTGLRSAVQPEGKTAELLNAQGDTSVTTTASVSPCVSKEVRRTSFDLTGGKQTQGYTPAQPDTNSADAYRLVPSDGSDREESAGNVPVSPVPSQPVIPGSSRARKDALAKDDAFAELKFVCETYMGRLLQTMEIDSLVYYYDTLKFSPELIEYLLESCISGGHKSFHYINKVALAWHQEGITTVAQAKKQSGRFNKQYYDVLRAFGVTNRSPIEKEMQLIDHWIQDYGFTSDIIAEACSRTISSINKVSFSYADSILRRWHQDQVHTLKDVQRLDTSHQERKSSRQKTAAGKKTQTNNRFNNFQQREYDYAALEQQLLGSSKE